MAGKKATVLVPLAAGFEEIEAVTVVDLLRRAGVGVTVAGVGGSRTVEGAHGISLQTDAPIAAVAGQLYSAVVLPGGTPGTANLAESREVEQIVKRHRAEGAVTAAICAAPTVLGRHGLLQGRKATCYPGFEAELGGARVVDDPVVDDGGVVTSRGPATAIAFALKLIERLSGAEKADQVGREILAR